MRWQESLLISIRLQPGVAGRSEHEPLQWFVPGHGGPDGKREGVGE